MAYPALTDIESAAAQLGIDPGVAVAWATLNQTVPVQGTDWMTFQTNILNTWQSWVTGAPGSPPPTGSPFASNAPIQIYYAYITDMGAYPPDVNTLFTWAQAACFVNKFGMPLTTPGVGYGYPPGSMSNSTSSSCPGSTPGGTTTPPGGTTTTTGPNIFDFGSFFAQVQTNPMGAISTYPGAAAVVGLFAGILARSFGLRL